MKKKSQHIREKRFFRFNENGPRHLALARLAQGHRVLLRVLLLQVYPDDGVHVLRLPCQGTYDEIHGGAPRPCPFCAWASHLAPAPTASTDHWILSCPGSRAADPTPDRGPPLPAAAPAPLPAPTPAAPPSPALAVPPSPTLAAPPSTSAPPVPLGVFDEWRVAAGWVPRAERPSAMPCAWVPRVRAHDQAPLFEGRFGHIHERGSFHPSRRSQFHNSTPAGATLSQLRPMVALCTRIFRAAFPRAVQSFLAEVALAPSSPPPPHTLAPPAASTSSAAAGLPLAPPLQSDGGGSLPGSPSSSGPPAHNTRGARARAHRALIEPAPRPGR